jgi:hypothetical protein
MSPADVRPSNPLSDKYTSRHAAVKAYQQALDAGFDAGRAGLRVTIYPTRVETIERRKRNRDRVGAREAK